MTTYRQHLSEYSVVQRETGLSVGLEFVVGCLSFVVMPARTAAVCEVLLPAGSVQPLHIVRLDDTRSAALS